MEQTQRHTAIKIWISNLLSGKYIQAPGEWETNYVESGNLKISRVNIIAHIVDTFSKPDTSYATLILDDGSGKIAVKSWKEEAALLSSFNLGELVLVVGKIRDYNNSLYLVPEVITRLDNPLWAKHRTLELKKLYGEAQTNFPQKIFSPQEEEALSVIEEKVTNDTPLVKKQKILDMIKKLDTNNGADQTLVIDTSGVSKDEAQKILSSLLSEGEIFEIHPGKLRTTL